MCQSLCLGDAMSDEVSTLGAIELDATDQSDSGGGGRRILVIRSADKLAALLGDLETDAFDDDLVVGGCRGRVRGHSRHVAAILLNVVQEPALLHLLLLQAVLSLGLLDGRSSSLCILLKNRAVDELEMSVVPAHPGAAGSGAVGVGICGRLGSRLAILAVQNQSLVAKGGRVASRTARTTVAATAMVRG